jgi:hypothetical protein
MLNFGLSFRVPAARRHPENRSKNREILKLENFILKILKSF